MLDLIVFHVFSWLSLFRQRLDALHRRGFQDFFFRQPSEISAKIAQIIVDGSVAHLTLVIASALGIVHGAIHSAEGIFPSFLKFDDVVADVLISDGFHLCDPFPLFDPRKEQFKCLLIA